MNMNIKYTITVVIFLLFLLASTTSALPTVKHNTVQGEVYVASAANWPSKNSTNIFDVSNGTVVYARYYVGVWASDSPTSIAMCFNGHEFDNKPSYYSSDMGVTWLPYNVTNDVKPGEKNTATIDSSSWGDGRQYGTTLLVVLQNKSRSEVEYWITEGLDWMHYGDYVGSEVDNSTTYFNGTIDLDDVDSASLYSTHLTGYHYEDLNGNSLSGAADSVSGDYFNYIQWDNVKDSLVAENQTVNVGRGDDTYCSVVLNGLTVEYKAPDLVPTALSPSSVSLNINNIMTATIENMGSKDSESFNVSFLVDGATVDTEEVSGLAIGNNTTVDFNWTPKTTKTYSLTVVVDSEIKLVEKNKGNNSLEVLVGTTSAICPAANFSADKTQGDAPLTVTFTDNSTNYPTFWLWDFGDDSNFSSTSQNYTVHTYTSIGNYTVKLTVANDAGSNSTQKNEYIVVNPIVADFEATPTSGVASLTVSFTDTSTGSPTSWLWDFGDGATSMSQNPSHTFSSLGSYTVKLNVSNDAGDSNTRIKAGYITTSVSVGPVWTNKDVWDVFDIGSYSSSALADLDSDGDYDLLIGCYGQKLYGYENTGSNDNPSWTANSSWDISLSKPDIAWPDFVDLDGDGDYDLLIGDYFGNILAYENTGSANSPVWAANSSWDGPTGLQFPVPALADLDGDGDNDLLIGAKDGVTYGYENAGNADSPVWTRKSIWDTLDDVGDLAAPAFADLDGDGDNDLLIGAKDGITYGYENTGNASSPVWTRKSSWDGYDVGSYSTPVLGDLDSDGDYDLLIGEYNGNTYAYENTASLSGSTLDLTPLAVDMQPNTANTTCIVNATINNNGTVDVGAFVATLAVEGVVVDTQGGMGPNAGGNASVSFSWIPEATGSYNLTVTVDPEYQISESDETNNNMTVLVTVKQEPPVANFTAEPMSGNSPLTVNFTDNSSNYPTSWLWEFGDGSNSTEQNPSHTYTAAGNYSVNLTVNNTGGNDSELKTDYIIVTEPDLIVSSITSPSTIRAQISSNIHATLNNTGTGDAETFNASLLVNGTLVDTVPVSGLSAGGSTEISFSWEPEKKGSYNLNVSADLENKINESNEANNSFTTTVTVLPEAAPLASFSTNVTSGKVPLTVKFTDQSDGRVTSMLWEFGDSNTSDEQNPIYTYTSAGTYTVKLTVSNDGGSDNKSETIKVLEQDKKIIDLSISGLVNTVPASAVFAREANKVEISDITNSGSDTATSIKVALYANDTSDTVPVAITNISSLAAGESTTVTIIDPTIRGLEGGTVTYTASLDPENLIEETNETNNNRLSVVKSIKYNGYKGKGIYWEGGSNITTTEIYDLRGDLIYSTQSKSAYKGVGWTTRTETWSSSDLPIPAGASVEKALLYISYNWDTTPRGTPNITAAFNGKTIELGTPYTDKSNFGTYADYKYGLYPAINVTNFFNRSGDNTLVITPNSGNSNALYPSTLAVIYRDSNATRKQIFINEECDELGYSESSYGTTMDEATAYVPFTGLTLDPAKVQNATLHSFAGSAGPSEGNLLFNGVSVATNAWNGTLNTAFATTLDVKKFLTATDNEASVQGTESGGMASLQQFLVVEYADTPVAGFSADKKSGYVPLTVKFTDNSSNSPTSWAWDFDNDGKTDSTTQNPTFTYKTPGTYSVKLTVSNPGGSDEELKSNYITVTEEPTQKQPDLIVSSILPSSNITANVSATIMATLNNTGTADAGAFNVSLFVNDTLVDTEPVSGLIAGGTTDLNFSWTPKLAGNCSLKIKADSEAEVSESDETNNEFTILVTVSEAEVPAEPVADFSADVTSGKAPLTVKFTDTSTGVPTSWAWDFDNDGITDSDKQNPSFTYETPGSYTVSLTVANEKGTDTETKVDYITVTPVHPTASFSADRYSGTCPLIVQFKDLSQDAEEWSWDFDTDAVIDSSEQNPKFTYNEAGNYVVNLTVSNSYGTDSYTAEIVVKEFKSEEENYSVSLEEEIEDINDTTKEIVINSSSSNVEVDNDTIKIDKGKLNISIHTDGVKEEGGQLKGNYTNATVETESETSDLGGNLSSVNTSLNATLSENLSALLKGNASITTTVVPGAPDNETESAFQLAGADFAEDMEIAYSLVINKSGLDGVTIKDAYISMTVPKTYVDSHGGTEAFVVMSLHEGKVTVLESSITENGDYYIFTAYSPDGFSVKALVSYTPKTETESSHKSGGGGSSSEKLKIIPAETPASSSTESGETSTEEQESETEKMEITPVHEDTENNKPASEVGNENETESEGKIPGFEVPLAVLGIVLGFGMKRRR